MYVLAGLNYGTFLLLAIVNFRLWKFVQARTLCATAKVEGSKHLTISIVFSLSYLYKGIYNTFMAAIKMNQMKDYMTNHTLSWCFMFFLLIFLGELLPLTLLFQY
jgi:hypothetical protein